MIFGVILLRRNRKGYKNIYRKKRGIYLSSSNKKTIITVLFILIFAAASYLLFLKPTNIECGVVIDKKDSKGSTSIKLAYNDKVKWISIKNNIKFVESDAYNVQLRGARLISISPCKVYTGKVLSRDSEKIVLDSAELKLSPKVFYYMKDGNKIDKSSQSKIVVGYSTYKFVVDSKNMVSAALMEKPEIKSVRVGVSNSDFTSQSHTAPILFTSISEKSSSKRFISGKGVVVKSKNINYTVPKDASLEISYGSDTLNLSLVQGNGAKSPIASTKDRVFISPAASDPTQVETLKRIDGSPRVYYGTFEVFIKDNSIRLINEVDIEQYLRFVVPSEMVPSGGVEGYKVQAVAARTYVLSDMLSGRFAKSGFHVDDTQLSQAYNAQGARSESDTAISETKGQVITYEGKVIDAKYYSTSCGVGAPFNEVWYQGKDYLKSNPEPYLTFKDYTGTGIKDLSKEEVALDFLKDWTVKAYDSSAQLFRWKFSMDKKQLNDTINKRIAEKFKEPSENLKKKWYFNIYRKAPVPTEGIGNIKDIYISKRGQGGNVMEMTIVTDDATYKINKGANIKYLIKPEKFTVTPLFGKPIENPGLIYSEFFVFDKEVSGGRIKNLTVYGGGFGHGAGISQYGIVGLVTKEKKSYSEVIQTFYEGVKLEDYNSVVQNSL